MKHVLSFFSLFTVLMLLPSCVEQPLGDGSTIENNGEYEGYLTEEGDENFEGEIIEGGSNNTETITDYIIKSGDILEIDGGRHKEINKQVRVDDKGYIKLRYINRVKIAGKTKWEAEDFLEKEYEPYLKNLQVSVEIMNLGYFIGGEVKLPGQKGITGNITLTQAIQSAGGYGPWENKKNVTIRRKDKQGKTLILKFNCEKIEKGEEEDPYIKPDDQITVPKGGGIL